MQPNNNSTSQAMIGWQAQSGMDSPFGRFDNGARPESDITFHEIAAMLWRRRLMNLIIVSVFVGGALGVTKLTHKKYQATSEMIVLQAASPQQSLATTNTAPSAMLSGITTPLIETPDTQVAMIASPGMAQRTLDYLKNASLKQNKTLADLGVTIGVDQLAANTLVINPKGTNLLEVSVTATNPETARVLTNAVSEAFVQWKREVAQQSVDEMSKNLDVRAERAHDALLAAERRETDFQKKWSLVDIPVQEKESLAQFFARQGDVAALQQDVAAHQVRLSSITAQLSQANQEIGAGGGVRDDLLLQSLQQQLGQAQMDLAAAQRKYTAAYPGILPDLTAHVADLQGRVTRAIGSAVHGNTSLQSQGALKDAFQQEQIALAYVQKKLAAATMQRDALSAQTAKWPELHNQYQRLENESDMARALYVALESQVSAAHSGKDMTTGNVQITQVALLPDMPVSPNLSLNIALGLVLGLIVSGAATLILRQGDRRVHTLGDAMKLISDPCIGTVPLLTSAESRNLREIGGDGYIRDAFGIAGANILQLGLSHLAERGNQFAIGGSEMAYPAQAPFPKVILVTSALPGEGKSTVASELAKAIGRSSRSVILVDADLRRPTQHHLFGLKQNKGLINVLGRVAEIDEVILETGFPNVQLVGSGAGSSGRFLNPAGLLSLPLLKEVLANLSERADVIIVDTPPSAVVPDALFLAPYVGSVLQVIGIEYADSDAVREATAALHTASTGAFGYLVNRAPVNRRRRYAYDTAYGRNSTSPWGDTSHPIAEEPSTSKPTELVYSNSRDEENTRA